MDITYKAEAKLTVEEIEQIIRDHLAKIINNQFAADKIDFKVNDVSARNDAFQTYALTGATVKLDKKKS